MPGTESLCSTNRSERIASWAAKPWRTSFRFCQDPLSNRLLYGVAPIRAQCDNYDAVGNWDSVTTNSTTQTRGANRQNEITSVSGATTPTYDSNGNLTKDENDNRFVWDAWNREVKIKNSTNTVIATNAYDALNHKVQVTTSSGTIDEFFSNNWQVLEGKSGSNTLNRYVWSPAYVDGLVTRDRDTDANGTLDERLFALQDANWNVTGITNTSGTIQERYTETPYGVVTFRDGSGSTISVSTKGWDILHQGAKTDIIGDYDFRNRVYSPTLGRWLSNDPIGFSAGDVSTFRYVGNGPENGIDPQGLQNKNPAPPPPDSVKDSLSPYTPPPTWPPPVYAKPGVTTITIAIGIEYIRITRPIYLGPPEGEKDFDKRVGEIYRILALVESWPTSPWFPGKTPNQIEIGIKPRPGLGHFENQPIKGDTIIILPLPIISGEDNNVNSVIPIVIGIKAIINTGRSK